jgi:uncharacterized protein YjbJ (UPF0337 family)
VNDDHVKGKVEELEGDVKQRIGGATKDRSLEAEGAIDEAKGKARQAAADVKDKVKDVKDNVKGAFKKDKDEDMDRDT